MNSQSKGLFYTLLIGAVLVPVVYMGGVDAAVECGDGYAITGTTEADYYENTGWLDFDSGAVCVDTAGVVTGSVESSNIGTIYFDQKGASVTISSDGVWSGNVYAPLNAYSSLVASEGTFFDVSTVSTDTETGLISGYALSSNLGELSFAGAVQDMVPLQVVADFSIGTYGDTVSGVPIADGGDSGYRIVATVDFSQVSFVDQNFVQNEFGFSGEVAESGTSDLRLDQISGSGSVNDAVTASDAFEFADYDPDTKIATYEYYIGSYAPTSDSYCTNLGTYENCGSSSGSYLYALSSVTVTGVMPRDFEWVGLDLIASGTLLDGDYYVVAQQAVAQAMSFAPIYEVDDFGIIGADGVTRADSADEVPPLAESTPYNFTGTVVRNSAVDMISAVMNVSYEITGSDIYTFGAAGCGSNSFAINNPVLGAIDGKPAFTAMELCPLEDGTSLGSDVVASANNAFQITFTNLKPNKTAYYESQYFSFADTRAEISEEPRVYVIGTVSGLAESDDVTVVGDMGRLELRDALYQQITKVVKNSTVTSTSAGRINNDGDGWIVLSGGEELVGGNVLYFAGDGSGNAVLMGGGEIGDQSQVVVVVGANLFVDSSIYKNSGTGEIGLIVLADENGNGGDLYVDSDVVDLHTNIFLDGSLIRANRYGVSYEASDLKNQLYILGSIVSKNTIEGYEAGVPPYICGDGSEYGEVGSSCTEAQAELEDLQYTSYFRVCCTSSACEYAGGDGNVVWDPTHPYEECAGYERSDYYDGDEWSFPVIIEYSPPSPSMPIFSAGGSSVGN